MATLTQAPAREPLQIDCPLCGIVALRVPRRPLDRLMSVFGRRRRFRCQSPMCGWEATLRQRDLG